MKMTQGHWWGEAGKGGGSGVKSVINTVTVGDKDQDS